MDVLAGAVIRGISAETDRKVVGSRSSAKTKSETLLRVIPEQFPGNNVQEEVESVVQLKTNMTLIRGRTGRDIR